MQGKEARKGRTDGEVEEIGSSLEDLDQFPSQSRT
uniref:Uncharacterized protein n=1 Tax=Anguilla anguilla TaxID=7936 RepID=A0A0E9XW87_ANGAN